MNLNGKKILVIGAGKSGVAVSRFLGGKGAAVVLADAGQPDDPRSEREELAARGVEIFLGGYPGVERGNFDLVVLSPGVPPAVEPARDALKYGIPLTGELELAFRFAGSPFIAVTGTNGKTTTTTLIGEIFKKTGRNVLVGGNIGVPLVTEVEQFGPDDLIVAEVSSFQLETAAAFKPRVGVILNITPDHLDRHGTMENYAAIKAKTVAKQDPGDYAVLNYDDAATSALGKRLKSKVIYFSRQVVLPEGVFVREGKITARLGQSEEIICPVNELGIPGAHNLENALAAVAATKVLGIESGSLADALRTFKGVSHRLEFVAEIDGVRYINDSKGTNPEASIKALESCEEPVILIAGGKNKGSDFSFFAGKMKEKARMLVVLGQSAGLIADAARARGFKNIQHAGDFREAVMLARQSARPGETVLLSPACASWDMFRSYEERGDLFKEIVKSFEI